MNGSRGQTERPSKNRVASLFFFFFFTTLLSLRSMEGASTTMKREESTTRYKGIRMRKWGKWVAEIREPNKRSRIWLGSYSSPVAAARAYDTALFYLRGPSARLNFPDLLVGEPRGVDISAAYIRKKAAEVGARVDALHRQVSHASAAAKRELAVRLDLNEMPEPENSEPV